MMLFQMQVIANTQWKHFSSTKVFPVADSLVPDPLAEEEE